MAVMFLLLELRPTTAWVSTRDPLSALVLIRLALLLAANMYLRVGRVTELLPSIASTSVMVTLPLVFRAALPVARMLLPMIRLTLLAAKLRLMEFNPLYITLTRFRSTMAGVPLVLVDVGP